MEEDSKLSFVGQMRLRLSGIVRQLSSPELSKDAENVEDKKSLRHSNRVKQDVRLEASPKVTNPEPPQDVPKVTNPASPKDIPQDVVVVSPKVLTTTSPKDTSNTSTLPCTQCTRYSYIYETGHISTRCILHLKPCDGCKGPNRFGGGQAYMYCRKCCKGHEVLFYREGYKDVE